MTGDLLLVALSQDSSFLGIARQAVHCVALEHGVNAAGRDFDVVIAFQIPDYPHRPEMVGAAQMKDLLLDFSRETDLRVSGARLAVDEGLLTVLLVCPLPLVEDFSGDAKVAAGMRNVAGLLGVVEHAQLSSDIVLSLSHSGPP